MAALPTITKSDKSEVGVIQSFKIELLLKHLKHAKNHQTLQAMSQKQGYKKKQKIHWQFWTPKALLMELVIAPLNPAFLS